MKAIAVTPKEAKSVRLVEMDKPKIDEIKDNDGNTALTHTCDIHACNTHTRDDRTCGAYGYRSLLYKNVNSVATFLLQFDNIDYNHVNKWGDTALIMACKNNHHHIILTLLKKKDIRITKEEFED